MRGPHERANKYVALYLHLATTEVSVREPGGCVIARSILPVEFFRGMRGSLHAAFEAGTQTQ